jgi:anhydro-N-acetylmuramic acid kinase
MNQGCYYVGLMSGTSADAIDAVLVASNNTLPHLIANYSSPIPPAMRTRIHALCSTGTNEIDRMGSLDVELGKMFASTVLQLLDKAGCHPTEITAIGSHGQTIRHRPPGNNEVEYPFTLQIGDPNTIAQLTGITTVADFRRRDMSAGGQGAPLVPAFHRAVFQSVERDRVIVNIGGMANITWIPQQGMVTGFDTGPGNTLMDGWINLHQSKAFDAGGQWANAGKVNDALLIELMSHNFFRMNPPKSTGREDFHLPWLKECLDKLHASVAPIDVQATLLQMTSKSIADQIHRLSTSTKEVIVCGGGAYNQILINTLQAALPNDRVCTSNDFGIAPEWIEAMAFAWLAEQTMARKPGNLRTVTGAAEEVILGGIYYA